MCATHYRQADRRRGTSTQRGYGKAHRTLFRPAVLERDPICVMPDCDAPATEADHYPLTRRELVAKGLDPDDPKHGRGLCKRCHSRHTASTSLA